MATIPLMAISGSEPMQIKRDCAEFSYIDENMVYPDYKIWSKLDYTVDIARAQVEDLVRNKTDGTHIAEELSNLQGDVRIFLMEDWLGRDRYGKVTLPGGRFNDTNYIHIVNLITAACLATGTIWVYAANQKATCNLLKQWNNEFFQREVHKSLMVRPRKAEAIFTLDFTHENQIWWLTDIPGLNIGFTRAEAMIDHAGSLINLFIMDRNQLSAIPGIGPIIADKFRTFIDKGIQKVG